MEYQPYHELPAVPKAKSRTTAQSRAGLTLLGVVGCVAVITAIVVFFGADDSGSTAELKHVRVHIKDDGIVFPVLNGTQQMELSVASLSAFRVAVSFTGKAPSQMSTPMVADQPNKAPFQVVRNGAVVGLQTAFGGVFVNTSTGSLVLTDANNKTITSASQFASISSTLQKSDTCPNPRVGYDIVNAQRTPSCPDGLKSQTQQSCCEACNNDKDCTVWVYADPGHEYDGYDCWLLMGSAVEIKSEQYRTTGGAVATPPPTIALTFSRQTNEQFYGAGAGSSTAEQLSQTEAYSKVTNTEFYTPHLYSSAGYAALAVSPLAFRESLIYAYPVEWTTQAPAPDNTVQWLVEGQEAAIYLIPASTQAQGLSLYWDLIGRAAVPPRYAFGFFACRWGWQDYNYIVDMLGKFRSGDFPIDAWISDFEWYTPTPDYGLPDTGSPTFEDFTYNNVTFPDPINNINTYHTKFNLRFGGIRKPRLGNSDLLVMAKSKGWTVDADHGGGAPGGLRNLNYSIPAVRQWYANQTAHFLSDGVDFYWNDEGESFYFAFHYWNLAQVEGLSAFNPNRRFFTINRSYTPGMQRLGATVWTGDVEVSWTSLQQQPGYMLNWALAGAAYVTCDTGGFNGGDSPALLLTRWFQVSAFLPIMRVHSSLHDTPHFPFLYPTDAADSMRKSLNLRYQLLPYHYSLAHATFNKDGRPIFRPMMMEFTDASVQSTTSQWMDGESILVCPVMQDNNSTTCILPAGDWFEFGTSTIVNGGQTLNLNNVPLDFIPMYVKRGSIITLAPPMQYSDQLPAGNLNVQVYSGQDATFVMVEDDGETMDYTQGTTRITTFKWSDSTKTLSWSVQGSFSDSHTFSALQVTAHWQGSTSTSNVVALASGGSVSF